MKTPPVQRSFRPIQRIGCLCIAWALVACGGAGTDQADTRLTLGPSQEQALLVEGAQLSRASLESAEQRALAAEAASQPLGDLDPGQIAPKSAYLSGAVARKAVALRIPAYRFYNGRTGAHFFTTSETERANVQANLSPPYRFEGSAFSVASMYSPGLSPVHRFYNTRTGVHFYTISEAERTNVVNTLPHYTYEGVAYHASQVAGAGLVPLYRFYVASRGFHFYTASQAERDSIIANLARTYSYEGVGYHVLATDWEPWEGQVPHTGVNSLGCYEGLNNPLVDCSQSGATNLNSQQDGHRAAIMPMTYASVGSNPVSNCVKDVVTGLTWEAKTTSGLRNVATYYTNLGNNSTSDASGYVAAVNASALCGYRDWRLPDAEELLSIVHHGKNVPPKINTTWFPYQSDAYHWTSTRDSTGNAIWTVDFTRGVLSSWGPDQTFAVRLVRGPRFNGPRFSVRTEAYAGDAANNAMMDTKTGMIWRRCLEGSRWDGSTCTGSPLSYTHAFALSYAGRQAPWRLPNVRELSSLMDRGLAVGLDTVAFPNGAATTWSSTPYVSDPAGAYYVNFGMGFQHIADRSSNSFRVHLVFDIQSQ